MKTQRILNQKGFSLINLAVTVSLIGILSSIAISNMKEINDPLVDASFQVTHFVRKARSEAISDTVSIQIAPISSYRIGAWSSPTSCSSTMTPVNDLFLNLPSGSNLSSTAWSICFSQRGLANSNITFNIRNTAGDTRTVEIALGGGVRIQ